MNKTISKMIAGSLCLISSVVSAAEITHVLTPKQHAQCSQVAYLITNDPSHIAVQIHSKKAVEGGLIMAKVIYNMGLAEGNLQVISTMKKIPIKELASKVYKNLCIMKEEM